MRILKKTILMLFLYSAEIFADGSLQCPIKPTMTSLPNEEKMLQMDSCVKNRSCSREDRSFICQWAFDRREKQANSPTTSKEQKEFVEETCQQCEELKKVSCIYDIREANNVYLKLVKIFVEDNDGKKPLIFGYSTPNPETNNLNLVANLSKLGTRNEPYMRDLRELTTKLSTLSSDVKTLELLRTNIQKHSELTSQFKAKWTHYHVEIAQLSQLTDDLYGYVLDWHARVQSLQNDPACGPVKDRIDSASLEGSEFLNKIQNIRNTMIHMELSNRLRLIEQFALQSIKQSYVAASKKSLEELEASLGSVLKLDQEVTRSGQWWIELNHGGLAGGLHTNYYQYEVPMKKLIQALADGRKFIEAYKAISGLSASVLNTAIKNQQLRVDEIQGDIDWLKGRGWEGQFKSQKESANRIMEIHGPMRNQCAAKLSLFLSRTKSIGSYEDFQRNAEPIYMAAIKTCEEGL